MKWTNRFNKKPELRELRLPPGFHKLSDGRIVSTAQAIAFKEEMEKRVNAFKPETAKIPQAQISALGIPKVDKIP